MAWCGWRSTPWGLARPANARCSVVGDTRRELSLSLVTDDLSDDLVEGWLLGAGLSPRPSGRRRRPGKGELRGQVGDELRLVYKSDLLTCDQPGSS